MIKKELIKTKFDIKKNIKDQNVIFLGNHCNFFDYKNNILNEQYKTEDCIWKNYDIFLKDYDYLDKLYNKIFNSLLKSLNSFHKVNKKNSFWEPIIGPWIMVFCVNLYTKWKISMFQSENENLFTEIDSLEDYKFNFLSIEDYKRKISHDSFNHIIFCKIFLFLKKNKNCKLDIVEIFENKNKSEILRNMRLTQYPSDKKPISDFKNITKKVFLKLYSYFTKRNKIVILRNYLGSYNNLKLNLSLKQLPCFYTHNLNVKNLCKNKDRKDFTIKFNCENLFEKFLLEEIVHHIPETFLEKFESTCNEIYKSGLPTKPQKIFITNYQFNTFLNFYIGLTKDKGSKLFSAQHGGCVGQYDRHWSENFEIKLSDKYFTYGWNSNAFPKKTLPIGFLKPIKKLKKYGNKNKKDILLIVKARFKYVGKLDSSCRSNYTFDYLENIYDFIDNLKDVYKKNLKIRLRDQDLGWHEHQRFQLKFPNLKFDFGDSNIFKMMKKSRIILLTNLGTSYLEALAMNIPTVIIANYEIEPIREDCKDLLNLLIDSKILHLNQLSAAKHIDLIYDDVNSWWFNRETQKNIEYFCNTYAKINININKELKEILNK